MRSLHAVPVLARRLLASRRRITAFSVAIAILLLAAACGRDVTIVGVLEPDRGKAVEDARTGFLEALSDADFKAGENMRFVRRNAEFRDEPLEKLARDLVEDEEVDFLFAIGTPALKAAIGAATGQQVFFALSADPTIGGDAQGFWRHPAILTGAGVPSPTADTVDLVRRLLPDATHLGVLYDSQDPDSVAGRDAARAAAEGRGFEVLAVAVSDAGQVEAAVQEAIGRGAHAIVLAPSKLLEDEFGVIRRTVEAAGVPVFAWSEPLTQRGALGSWGIDYEENGRNAGALAVRVLRGQDPSQAPISTDAPPRLWLSQRVAKRLGIALPDDLVARASKVFR
ncbi:MAG: ABC transporter substrate-binding protein [Dehalococcoidia bacterium]